MIKRRFYKHEHGDTNGPSDSSSSSDSELEAEATEDTEEDEEEEDAVVGERGNDQPSGYESEDSSANEGYLDSSGLPAIDNDMGTGSGRQNLSESHLFDENNAEILNTNNTEADKDGIASDVQDYVLKSKSVFKCKICPRIVCLTEETLKAHLKSKRHARSEKLLSSGRLKLMLNSDEEIEGETHQERHAATLACAQSIKSSAISGKKNKGRQRQRKRMKKKTGEDLTSNNKRPSAKHPAKKRRKTH